MKVVFFLVFPTLGVQNLFLSPTFPKENGGWDYKIISVSPSFRPSITDLADAVTP